MKPKPEQEYALIVVDARNIRAQPILADFAPDLGAKIELVGHAGNGRIALVDAAQSDIVAGTEAQLEPMSQYLNE